MLYALTISLSAFLLFAVQPIIAKMILPWFGGTSAVWTTCMLFFQAVLLLGYLYAHWLHEKVPGRKQAYVHIPLLVASLATLPIIPNPVWRSPAVGDPSLRILTLLSLTVGLPYFLLSSTSPLLQAWYARTHSRLPYRLFALSNTASMAALLSYPFLIEPNLPARLQAWSWSAAYIGFAALCAWMAWAASRLPGPSFGAMSQPEHNGAARPSLDSCLMWLGLAACASVLLLAVTNHLTEDVAAIPFLWILPLSIYLLSFIICFEAPRAYHRGVFLPLLAVSLAFMTYQLWPYHKTLAMRPTIAAFGAALFVCCMVCHGELVRLKPHPRYLTGFYVAISLGGVCGGLFVGLFAPNLFHAYYEFPLGMALCAMLATRLLVGAAMRVPDARRWAACAALALVLGGYLWAVRYVITEMVDGYELVARNFYGQLKLRQDGVPPDEYASLQLIHGTINHGQQFLSAIYRDEPVTYFCPDSGVGRAMRAFHDGPRRIGILGLGCGTLAAYGAAGDTLRIYEINPLVVAIARHDFSYLHDTHAKVEVTLGDGRMSLESEPSQQFDLLVMDAFSGDSVPVHLITKEAFRTYFRHLKPGGILVVNTTNSYLDLNPVMERAAAAVGKVAYSYNSDTDPNDPICFPCSWALIMDAATMPVHPGLERGAQLLRPGKPFRTWTDDFSNLFSILR